MRRRPVLLGDDEQGNGRTETIAASAIPMPYYLDRQHPRTHIACTSALHVTIQALLVFEASEYAI